MLTIEFAQLEAEIVRILEQASAEAARAASVLQRRAEGSSPLMTRILLALLAFYRRWLSPALHALEPGRLQVSAHLLGVRGEAIATHGPLRGCGAGRLEAAALPSLSPAEASTGVPPTPAAANEQPFSPQTVTIESGA